MRESKKPTGTSEALAWIIANTPIKERKITYGWNKPIIMKPTHILVPIEWVEDTFDQLSKIPTSVRREDSNGKMRILNQIKEMPSIDLSEEGIKIKAKDEAPFTAFYMRELKKDPPNDCVECWKDGYKQCAKDLLNTKL